MFVEVPRPVVTAAAAPVLQEDRSMASMGVLVLAALGVFLFLFLFLASRNPSVGWSDMGLEGWGGPDRYQRYLNLYNGGDYERYLNLYGPAEFADFSMQRRIPFPQGEANYAWHRPILY